MTTYQRTLNGNRVALGTQMDRIQSLMEADEDCRNYLMEMLAQLWMDDGLQYKLCTHCHEPFMSFMVTDATNAKSAINRMQDLQRLHAHLAPSPDVAEKRGRG